MRLFYTVLFLFYVIALAGYAVSAERLDQGATLRTLGSYSRISVPLDNGASFKVFTDEKNTATIIVKLDRVDPQLFDKISQVNDARIKILGGKKTGLDSGEISIQMNTKTLDYFAYAQSSPNAVIIDFWSDEKKLAKAAYSLSKAELPAAGKKQLAFEKKVARAARNLASIDDSAAESLPFTSFPSTLLSVDKDIFEKFPMPMPPLSFKGQKFSIPVSTEIENDWVWSHAPKNEAVSEDFNFAVKLFENKKYGLCVRTIEVAERDFPGNRYGNELDFLRAIAYKKIGEINKKDDLVNHAEETFRTLMLQVDANGKILPMSPVIRLYFAKKSYQLKQWLEAVEQLEYIAKVTPERDPDYAGISLAMSDAYFQLGQYRRAERVYRYIAEKFHGKTIGKEATYRIGNVLSYEKKYDRAIEEIESARAEYPEYKLERPESTFNLAEAYFWKKRYGKAREKFEEFVKNHPSHTIGGLAWVRLGELAELDKKNATLAREKYLNAQNQFPFSLGDSLAILRQARLGLSSEKDLNYQIKSIEPILANKEYSPTVHHMAQTALIQYLLRAGDPSRAIELSRGGLTETSGDIYDIYKDLYVKSLSAKLAQLNEQKKYSDALALFENEKKWFSLADPTVYKVVAEVYRGLGLFDTSNKFMTEYTDGIKKLQAAGRLPASEKFVAQQIRITRAKNDFAEEKYAEAISQLQGIDVNQSADLLRLLAISNLKLSRYDDAYKAAEKSMELYVRDKAQYPKDQYEDLLTSVVDVYLDHSIRNREFKEMEQNVDRVRKYYPAKQEKLEFLYADALWSQKNHKAAIPAYQGAIKEFSASARVARAKYNLSISYLSVGKRTDAVNTLTELRDSGQGVWSLSAKQELQLLDWDGKYSSVLRTLPPTGLGVVN